MHSWSEEHAFEPDMSHACVELKHISPTLAGYVETTAPYCRELGQNHVDPVDTANPPIQNALESYGGAPVAYVSLMQRVPLDEHPDKKSISQAACDV